MRLDGAGAEHLRGLVTRGGDEGETSLGDGSRVSKLDCRIGAFGDQPWLALVGIYVLANVFTEVLTNNAAAVKVLLARGADAGKDQSYMLAQLDPGQDLPVALQLIGIHRSCRSHNVAVVSRSRSRNTTITICACGCSLKITSAKAMPMAPAPTIR